MEFSPESINAIGRISHKTPQGRQKLTDSWHGWFNRVEQAKWQNSIQHYENGSFLAGNHLTRFWYTPETGFGFHTFGVHDSNKFDSVIAAKSSDNRLIRPVQNLIGMLTENMPQGRVEPNTDNPEDQDAAHIAEAVLQLVWERPMNMAERLQELITLAAICGTAAIETTYAETGEQIEVPKYEMVEEPNPLFLDEEGKPRMIEQLREVGTQTVPRRDIRTKVYSTFHLIPDPSATSPDEMNWIGRVTYEDRDWVLENFTGEGRTPANGFYPDAIKEKAAGSGTARDRSPLFWWSQFADIMETPQYQYSGGTSANAMGGDLTLAPNMVEFVVVDVRPTKQFPKGRTLVFVEGELLYCGIGRSYAEKHTGRWHPYSFFSWFKLPGRWRGIAMLSFLVPLQKKINAIDALFHANRQFVATGQWLIPKHSKVVDGGPSSIPGDNLLYTDVPGMSKPEKIQNNGLPGDLWQERGELVRAIDLIAASGLTDDKISGSAARAGVILDFIREERMRSQSPMVQNLQRCVESVARNVLIEFQRHLLEEDPELTRRVRSAAREHSNLTVEHFVGSDLLDHTDVTIDVATAIRNSPEAKRAHAVELGTAFGAYLSPDVIYNVIEEAGYGHLMTDDRNDSAQRAKRMVGHAFNGQLDAVFPIPDFDDPMAMAPIFARAVRSVRFIEAPQEVKDKLYVLGVYYRNAALERMRQITQEQSEAQK